MNYPFQSCSVFPFFSFLILLVRSHQSFLSALTPAALQKCIFGYVPISSFNPNSSIITELQSQPIVYFSSKSTFDAFLFIITDSIQRYLLLSVLYSSSTYEFILKELHITDSIEKQSLFVLYLFH